jgi:hypothetical protein
MYPPTTQRTTNALKARRGGGGGDDDTVTRVLIDFKLGWWGSVTYSHPLQKRAEEKCTLGFCWWNITDCNVHHIDTMLSMLLLFGLCSVKMCH